MAAIWGRLFSSPSISVIVVILNACIILKGWWDGCFLVQGLLLKTFSALLAVCMLRCLIVLSESTPGCQDLQDSGRTECKDEALNQYKWTNCRCAVGGKATLVAAYLPPPAVAWSSPLQPVAAMCRSNKSLFYIICTNWISALFSSLTVNICEPFPPTKRASSFPDKLFISLATCELLSIWSDPARAPDEINSCIDWVATGGTGPWPGPAQLRDEVSDRNAFSRVRSHPLRQEIFCRLETLDVLVWTLIYRQLTPKSIFSSYKHGSRGSRCDWIPKKDLEVLPFMLPLSCSPLGELLAPFCAEQRRFLAPSMGTAGPRSSLGLCDQSHYSPLLPWQLWLLQVSTSFRCLCDNFTF